MTCWLRERITFWRTAGIDWWSWWRMDPNVWQPHCLLNGRLTGGGQACAVEVLKGRRWGVASCNAEMTAEWQRGSEHFLMCLLTDDWLRGQMWQVVIGRRGEWAGEGCGKRETVFVTQSSTDWTFAERHYQTLACSICIMANLTWVVVYDLWRRWTNYKRETQV